MAYQEFTRKATEAGAQIIHPIDPTTTYFAASFRNGYAVLQGHDGSASVVNDENWADEIASYSDRDADSNLEDALWYAERGRFRSAKR